MATQRLSIFGIYSNYKTAEMGLDALRSGGFESGDVSVLFPEHMETPYPKHTKAPAATGAEIGAWFGGALGWLVGMGTLAIPGVGPFIAAGPIAAALVGAGAGGAIGGIAGTLAGMGVPASAAKRYEAHVKSGGILVSVHPRTEREMERARTILERTGAQDIASGAEADAELAAKATEPATVREASPVLRASQDAVGKPVDNLNGENIGTIEELMIDKTSGRITYAILSFGGFLGMGDKLFAVPWASLNYDGTQGIFVIDADKERLKLAPGFDKNHWPDLADPSRGLEISEYYHTRMNL